MNSISRMPFPADFAPSETHLMPRRPKRTRPKSRRSKPRTKAVHAKKPPPPSTANEDDPDAFSDDDIAFGYRLIDLGDFNLDTDEADPVASDFWLNAVPDD